MVDLVILFDLGMNDLKWFPYVTNLTHDVTIADVRWIRRGLFRKKG